MLNITYIIYIFLGRQEGWKCRISLPSPVAVGWPWLPLCPCPAPAAAAGRRWERRGGVSSLPELERSVRIRRCLPRIPQEKPETTNLRRVPGEDLGSEHSPCSDLWDVPAQLTGNTEPLFLLHAEQRERIFPLISTAKKGGSFVSFFFFFNSFIF